MVHAAAAAVPHDFENNVVHISVWKNPQKQRKPCPDPARRRDIYWDLRGRHQVEYDLRLDALPEDGVAGTVAGEIFRSATKIYYDFFNNAMVNNTSGALNYLAKTGVLSPSKHSAIDATLAGIFETIHPYTVGARIHFGELDILYAVEALMDRTLEFLRENPALDAAANSLDYHTLRDREERPCMERCAIRNRMARDMEAEAARWAKEVEGRQQQQQQQQKKGGGSSGKKKKNWARKKAQDHKPRTPSKGGAPWSGSSGEKNKENNGKKKKKSNRDNKGSRGSKKNGSFDKSKQKGTDLSAKFCKLGLGH